MKKLFAFIGVVVISGVGTLILWPEESLLKNEECLKYAYDVLGDASYSKSCKRSSYADNIETLNTSNTSGGAAIFIFRPAAGNEALCPPIKVLVDRRNAEVSLITFNDNESIID